MMLINFVTVSLERLILFYLEYCARAKCHAVVLLGDTEVGKTNMVNQFTQGQFDENAKRTLGVKPTLKMTQVGSSTVKVAVWDTAGQERYRAPVNYYYDAVAVFPT